MRLPRAHPPLFFVLAALAPVAASGQPPPYASLPLAADLKRAAVGSWADYTIRVGGPGGATMKTRWALLGRDAGGNTLELTIEGPPRATAPFGGKVVTRMVLVPDPVGVSRPIKQMVMQLGEHEPVEVPLDLPGLPGQKFLNPDPKRLVGKESITVTAGTFTTSHYREPLEEGTLDSWLSDRVPPPGVVRIVATPKAGAVGPGGQPMPPVVMELVAHGKDARPVITRPARPLGAGDVAH